MMEKIIDLLECAILQLGHVEVTPHRPQETSPAKNKADFALEVRLVWVDHIRHNDVHHGAERGLTCCRKADGFGSQGWCGDFAEQGESDASDCDLVDECIDDRAGGLDPAGGSSVHNIEDSHQDEHDGHANHAPDEEFSASDGVDGHPGNDHSHYTASRDTNTEIKGVIDRDTCKLEEIGREAEDEDDTGEMLACEHADRYDGSDKVGALEALDPVRCSGEFLILFHGADDHGEFGSNIGILAVKSFQGSPGIFNPATAHIVPWGFWCEGDPNEKDDYLDQSEGESFQNGKRVLRTNKQELDSKRPSESPPVIPAAKSFDHSIGQELADDNRKVDAASDHSTNDNGSDL